MQNKDEIGRSMIEMLGVLAIIGVLSVGGIAGYSKAMYRYRLNKTIEQITQIAGNVRAFFAPQKSYTGLRDCYNDNKYCKLYKKAKLLPDDMWDETAKKYINVYGYVVQLYAISKDISGDDKSFVINFYGIPQEACIDLITHDWSIIGINSVIVGNINLETEIHSRMPIDVNRAIDMCDIVPLNETGNSYLAFSFQY